MSLDLGKVALAFPMFTKIVELQLIGRQHPL